MPGGFFCFNSLDRFIFNIKVVCLFFVFSCFVEISALNANSIDPDQMPHSAASDLGLHWLWMSHLWDARQRWVKQIYHSFFCILGSWKLFSRSNWIEWYPCKRGFLGCCKNCCQGQAFCLSNLVCSLTLKALITTAVDMTFCFVFLFVVFRENQAWHFMWLIWHETLSLVFSEE